MESEDPLFRVQLKRAQSLPEFWFKILHLTIETLWKRPKSSVQVFVGCCSSSPSFSHDYEKPPSFLHMQDFRAEFSLLVLKPADLKQHSRLCICMYTSMWR